MDTSADLPQEPSLEQARIEFSDSMAGVPDSFQRLWTPHRMAYINGESKPTDDTEQGCPFCRAPGRDDADGLVVHRGRTCYVVMNLFPYSPGHLLVCPYRHISWYTDANDEEVAEMAQLTRTAMSVLLEQSHPHGFNLGMNQGEVAGAGIAAHLHQHVVPRWRGDANFLPIIGQTKAVPELLDDARARLAAGWPEEG